MTAIIALSANLDINKPGLALTHQHLQLNGHSSLSLTKMHSENQTSLVNNFRPNNRMAALHFILNGQTYFSQNDNTPPANFLGDKCNLMLIQPHHTEQTISAKGDFMLASFYMEMSYFFSILETAAEALPVGFKRAAVKNTCSCTNFLWQPAAYNAIMKIIHHNAASAGSKLFLESKMLELIAVLLDARECDYVSKITITKKEVDKIHFGCDLLMADLRNPPSLSRLALLAGTNEFILKKGFREVFGKPVYQYLLQRRMERAMEQLMQTDLPVAEIGLLVGYEDASAFTRAFTKYFNQKPTEVRKYS